MKDAKGVIIIFGKVVQKVLAVSRSARTYYFSMPINFTLLQSFQNRGEAERARDMLLAQNIETMIQPEDALNPLSPAGEFVKTQKLIRLLVLQEDQQRAREILGL